MDGLLVVDKPAGPTSHDVVQDIRRLSGENRVGHAGTLDPAATGVLLLLIGKATKLSERFLGDDKTYTGTIRFGMTTDTLDAAGKTVEERGSTGLTLDAVEKAVLDLTGDIEQIPPMVSAIKVNGQPLYKAARRGQIVDVPPRQITVRSFIVNDWRPGDAAEADFTIDCSKGTYIRSLARDLGEAVGCGAHLAALRRTRSGEYSIEDAIPLSELEEGGLALLTMRLIPLESL
ncbi:MAG: tRNA pseudouridine(55) synthase TruB [Actinomycetota bacterium]